jgi:hypothetical protein
VWSPGKRRRKRRLPFVNDRILSRPDLLLYALRSRMGVARQAQPAT